MQQLPTNVDEYVEPLAEQLLVEALDTRLSQSIALNTAESMSAIESLANKLTSDVIESIEILNVPPIRHVESSEIALDKRLIESRAEYAATIAHSIDASESMHSLDSVSRRLDETLHRPTSMDAFEEEVQFELEEVCFPVIPVYCSNPSNTAVHRFLSSVISALCTSCAHGASRRLHWCGSFRAAFRR